MTESTIEKPIILVVDDSRLMRVAARKILKNEFEIIDAEDGEIAWDILQDHSEIALVMSDLSMPNLDGLELLKKIRGSNQPHVKELPVIIVTGAEDDDGSKNTALSAGATDFITKPFESVLLLARTTAQAKQHHTRQALRESESSVRRLEQQNKPDAQAGLADRPAFMRSLEEQLSYATRHRTELSLLVVRLEKYKILFLRRGKQGVEKIFHRITSLLCEKRRLEDKVARLGPDTIGVLMSSANEIGAGKVGRQLIATFAEEDFRSDHHSAPVRLSVGVSSLAARHDLTAEQIMDEAVQALSPSIDSGFAAQKAPPQAAATPKASEPHAVMATPADVHQALQAILTGARPSRPADQLVRASLPLLDYWNRSTNNRYLALVEALKSALAETTADQDTQQPAKAPPVRSQ